MNIQDLKNRKIILLIGYSGSGKTTATRTFLASDKGKNYVAVGRDKIRELLFAYSEYNAYEYYAGDISESEQLVTKVLNDTITSLLMSGKDIVIDNTNLDIKYITKLRKTFYYCDFTLIDIPTYTKCSLELAKKRDNARSRKVGKEVINSQYDRYNTLVKKFAFDNGVLNISKYHEIKELVNNKELPPAVIFDIDGTLADNTGRNPFDWKKVDQDSLRRNVAHILHLHANVKTTEKPSIIVCTGRSEEAATLTKAWLNDHGLVYDAFYSRKRNDFRPDWQIKEEIWREIARTKYIIGMYDDRDQIILHSRLLGLDALQVNYGNF